MSRINVDLVAFTDHRFGRLASLLKLADADHARAKVEHLWLACTMRGEHELPQWLVEQHLGEGSCAALVESELARWSRGRGDSKTRRLYICGSLGRTEWLRHNQEQSPKGGKARAQKSSRVAGRFTSPVAGDSTSPLSPALSPAPALSHSEKNSARPSGGVPQPGLAGLEDAIERNLGEVGRARARGKRPKGKTDWTAHETAIASLVLEKLGAQSGVAYSGTDEHKRLIIALLRRGITEVELRGIVGYCAIERGWKDDPEMHAYLRPETLFGPKTHAKYLDAARQWLRTLPPEQQPQPTVLENPEDAA